MTTLIFHLRRRDGRAVFLHPFSRPKRLLEILQKTEVEGRFGVDPDMHCVTAFRSDLYRMVDAAVRRWVCETRSTAHLLVAAGVFLIAYLYATLATNNARSVAESLLIALCAAAFGYGILLWSDVRSAAAAQLRRDLRARVDRILFRSDPFVRAAERELDCSDGEPSGRCIERSLDWESRALVDAEAQEAAQFIELLGRRFTKRQARRAERLLEEGSFHRPAPKIRQAPHASAGSRRGIDLSLYLLCEKMRKSSNSALPNGEK